MATKDSNENNVRVQIAADDGRCARCERSCLACCEPCRADLHPVTSQSTCCQKIIHAFMCPPHGNVAVYITAVLIALAVLGTLVSTIGDEALPYNNFFGLLILTVACMLGGRVIALIRLPPLLGMLIVGIVLRNVPVINVARGITSSWSSALRSIALVIILLRAGLGIDPGFMRRQWPGILRLAIIPCMVEVVAVAGFSVLLLKFDWKWGFILGFVLSACSPAVVVPAMISLTERRRGTNKGIPTLMMAATSVEDVLAISGFGVVMGVVFAKESLAWTIVKAPLQIVIGIAFGILYGFICWILPNPKSNGRNFIQFLMMFFGGMVAIFGSKALGMSGAGAFGCPVLAFVAALKWKDQVKPGNQMAMKTVTFYMWQIFEPLLFGLIGAAIDVNNQNWPVVGMGAAVFAIANVFRLPVAFLTGFGINLNKKEKFFVPFARFPKATVQAAIGSIALDSAKALPIDNVDRVLFMDYGAKVLSIAVLVIVISAPLGALAIALLGPKLLHKEEVKVTHDDVKEPVSTGNGKPQPPQYESETEMAPLK